MALRIETFADILAPVTPDEFFAEYHGKRPLHVPGSPDKFAEVMSWTKLSDILNISTVWLRRSRLQLNRDNVMVPAKEYSSPVPDLASGTESLWPDPERVIELLRQGASMVCNDIDSLNPGLTAIATALEQALEAKVQANLYCSWQAHQAFATHFDAHDVYAIHVEGEKIWRLYEGTMELPVEHPDFRNFGQDYHDKARGRVAQEVTLKPGDFLYLPRGTYHDALALSAGCVHISFGPTAVTGLDYVSALFDRTVQDPLFRADMPLLERPGGETVFADHLKRLADRLGEIATGDDMISRFMAFQRNYRFDRGGFDLPGDVLTNDAPANEVPANEVPANEVPAPRYEVTKNKLEVVRDGKGWVLAGEAGKVPIPPGHDKSVVWVIGRQAFSRVEFDGAFPETSDRERSELLRALAAMKVIAAV